MFWCIVLFLVWSNLFAQEVGGLNLLSIPLPQNEKKEFFYLEMSNERQIEVPSWISKLFDYVNNYSSLEGRANEWFFKSGPLSSIETEYSKKFVKAASYIYIADLVLHNETKEKLALFHAADIPLKGNLFNGKVCFFDVKGLVDNDKEGEIIGVYAKTGSELLKKYEETFDLQGFYTRKLRLQCLRQLNEILKDISHEDFVAIGFDFNYLLATEGMSRVYADLACLRGSYNFLRNEWRVHQAESDKINSLIFKWGYRSRFGLDRYKTKCSSNFYKLQKLKIVKEYIESSWYSCSLLQNDAPKYYYGRLVLSDFMLCSLDGIVEGDSVCVQNNILQNLQGLSSRSLCLLNVMGNDFLEITGADIDSISSKDNWKLSIPASIQNFPIHKLLFCKPGEIIIMSGNQAQREQLRQQIVGGWHLWARKALPWAICLGLGCLFLYGGFKVSDYFAVWQKSILNKMQVQQDRYVEWAIDNYGVASVANAYFVGGKYCAVAIPELLRNKIVALDNNTSIAVNLLDIIKKTPQPEGSSFVDILALASMAGYLSTAVPLYFGSFVNICERFSEHTIEIDNN